MQDSKRSSIWSCLLRHLLVFSVAGCLILPVVALAEGGRSIRTVSVAKPTLKRERILAGNAHLTADADGAASLILDLPREVAIEPSFLTEPKRLIIDLPDMGLVQSGEAVPMSGAVSAWRFGLFTQGGSRIVLDLKEPAILGRIDTLPTPFGVRMVIAIKAAGEAEFEAAAQAAAAERATGTIRGARKVDGQKIAQAAPAADVSPVPALPLVVIDPGHGGIDVGATGAGGEIEKTLVLDIGLQLKQRLEETGKVRVEMTRDSDVFVALPQRVRIAREKSASLFISIHADTLIGEPNVRGATVYTLSDKASDASAARLAEKENKADQIAGLDASDDKEEVSDILFDLARRETRQFSLGFAKGLMAKLQSATQINKNPHRFAGFRVLKAPDVPSVLLEIGYLSSADDAKLITSHPWQEKMTSAAAEAVLRFLALRGQDQGASPVERQ